MNKTVCIIDDDELLRAHLAQIIEAAGYRVLQSDGAEAALGVIQDHSPEVALVDVIMPHTDGLELLSVLRTRWPRMRIVVMSGGGRVGPAMFLEAAARVGADACLSKPIADADLLRVLEP